jgi:2-polyprenyl-6-methoxyphenol hydroxylase-like FAD-dependent oxidoreductase
MRRTVLHRLLVERARAVGVSMVWGAPVTKQDSVSAEIEGRRVFFRWLVAADGIHSIVRRRAGLDSNWRRRVRGRFAFRRHYAVAPWTDLVEVHWGRDCQMIVTPTSRDEICLALFTSDHRVRIGDALEQFPSLARRIRGACGTSVESGARTALARSRFVVRGNVALAGDAACSIDGIAGQGLSLAFQSAIHLADSLAREDLRGYAAAHRKITHMRVRITRLMLLMARYPWIRKRTLRMFAARPAMFSSMMSIHAGASGAESFGLQDLFGLGWRVLRA